MDKQFDKESMIAKWLSDELTDNERTRFEQWLADHPEEQAGLQKLQTAWRIASDIVPPAGASFETRWGRIKKTTVAKPRGIVFLYRVAASLAIIVITSVYLWNGKEIVRTQRGQIQHVSLPDGSQVTLNAESVVQYNPRLWFLQRHVILKGEAYFEVKSGAVSFTVNTTPAIIKVVGTAFNVRFRNNATVVACVNGSVNVQPRNQEKHVVLTGGLTATTTGTKIDTSRFDLHSPHVIPWISGKLHFSQTPLKDVFDELERSFDIQITYTGPDNLTFTGRFDNSNVQYILDVICKTAGLQYIKSTENTFIIRK